jgi:phosphohistidine phosphatase
MKRLILVRHGKADQEKTEDDFARNLIKSGKRDAKLIAGVLVNNNIKPEIIASSSANRALETAQIMAEVFGLTSSNVQTESFLYDGYTTGQLTDFLAQFPDNIATVMVIGHNPFISQTGIRLSKNFHQSFPTTGCLGLKFETDSWKLDPGEGEIDFFEFPKKYR